LSYNFFTLNDADVGNNNLV